MLGNYLKISLRNIKRQKGYSAINIFGLSAGIACSLLIFLYVQYELSYDSYHKDSDRIYRIITSISTPNETFIEARGTAPLVSYLKESFPQVEFAARFRRYRDLHVRFSDKIFKEKATDILYADPEIFSILTLRFLTGEPDKALSRPSTAVITETTAEKYFGDENPLGKSVTIGADEFEITGIIGDLPGNTAYKFNFLLSWSTNDGSRNNEWLTKWIGLVPTFVKLVPGEDPEIFAGLITDLVRLNGKQEFENQGSEVTSILQPIKKIHLHSNDFRFDLAAHNNILYIYIFFYCILKLRP